MTEEDAIFHNSPLYMDTLVFASGLWAS